MGKKKNENCEDKNPSSSKKEKNKDTKKNNETDGISKSRQLIAKNNIKKPIVKKSKTARVCGSGKEMPPLSILKTMFESSNEDVSSFLIKEESTKTPEKPPTTNESVISPRLLASIAVKCKEFFGSAASQTSEENTYSCKRKASTKVCSTLKFDDNCNSKKKKANIGVGSTSYDPNKQVCKQNCNHQSCMINYLMPKAARKSTRNKSNLNKRGDNLRKCPIIEKFESNIIDLDELETTEEFSPKFTCTPRKPSDKDDSKKIELDIDVGLHDFTEREPVIDLCESRLSPNTTHTKGKKSFDSKNSEDQVVDLNSNLELVETCHTLPPSFSPIPSTSKNDVIFEQNAILLNESLSKNSIPDKNKNITNENFITTNIRKDTNDNVLPLIELDSEIIVNNDNLKKIKSTSNGLLLTSDIKKSGENRQSIDKMLNDIEDDTIEIDLNDVDAIIEENKKLLKETQSLESTSTLSITKNEDPVPKSDRSLNYNPVIREALPQTDPLPIRKQNASQVITSSYKPTYFESEVTSIVENFFKAYPTTTAIEPKTSENLTSIGNFKTLFFDAMNWLLPKNKINRSAPKSTIVIDLNESSINNDDVIFIEDPVLNTTDFTEINNIANFPRKRKTRNRRNNAHTTIDTGVVIDLNDADIEEVVPVKQPRIDKSPSSTTVSPSSKSEKASTLNSSGMGNRVECPICMENFASKPLASTLCGHIFCLNCLETVLKTTKKCPTCRKTINKRSYHRIFI